MPDESTTQECAEIKTEMFDHTNINGSTKRKRVNLDKLRQKKSI